MRKFFKILKYLFISILILLIVGIAGLNIYYSVLLKSITNREYPDPSTLTSNLIEDELIDYKINLIPYPRHVELIPGLFKFPADIKFHAPTDIHASVLGMIDQFFDTYSSYDNSGNMRFIHNPDLNKEAYFLKLQTNKVEIQYSDISGAYYALLTLKQLNKCYSGLIPNLIIKDEPDIEMRGVMLDISRDKVPTLETLYGIVDILADLKYNHLELYVEGFSFAYPSFESLWRGKETPITGEEIRELDKYCMARFIDLVPNQNALGHMTAWLETDQFADLAECPDGFSLTPFVNMKSTLDPYDPRSIQLVDDMIEDIIPNFSSEYFNVNMDEPFELGHCKSKKKAEEIGVGRVYLDFAKQVHQLVKKHNRKMMMWGDVVLKHPEITSEIPEDIIVLDWGYEAEYPFDKNGSKFKKTGLDFIVCPGTSSWGSIGGRTNNMVGNISNAVKNGAKHGAKGMLMTDWGDMGHWQYLPVSYAGFVVGGGLSWNTSSYSESMLEHYLDVHIYQDANKKMGSFTLDLGRYNQFEEIRAPNMTLVNLGFQFGLVDHVLYQTILNSFPSTFEKLVPVDLVSIVKDRFKLRQPYNYMALLNYLDEISTGLQSSAMQTTDAELIADEYKNGITFIKLGASLKNYIEQEKNMSRSDKITYLEKMREDYSVFLTEHKRLWLSRNKSGGLDRSMTALLKVEKEIRDQIELLNKGPLARSWDRLKDRTITAVAAVVL